MQNSDQITVLLESDKISETENIDQLFQLLYKEIKNIASIQLRKLKPDDALSPTVLVNECYLKLHNTEGLNLQNRKHFYCIAAKSMRFYLMDLFKSRFSQKREGINTVLSLTKLTEEDPVDFELESLDEALTELEQIDEELARLVELRFFWGFTLDDVAEIFETSKNKIYQKWLMAKSLLLNLIQDND
jgi:RNA polymerase sigma factor (TIGR02999 family)